MTEAPVVLVTGGTRGLGRAVAQRFVADGAQVITCSRSIHEGVEGAMWTQADMRSLADVDWLVQRIRHDYGQLDVLVCCAAVYGPVGRMDEVGWHTWRNAVEVNLLGAALCCRVALPLLRNSQRGKVVLVSGGGVRPDAGATAYNASKGGVQRFAEALAVDEPGLDVNVVAPGLLQTTLRPDAPAVSNAQEAMQRAVDLIAWLSSRASDGVSGRLLSAVWDDVTTLPNLSPDDYRMRRVVPA